MIKLDFFLFLIDSMHRCFYKARKQLATYYYNFYERAVFENT